MTLSLIYVFVSLTRAIQHVLQRKCWWMAMWDAAQGACMRPVMWQAGCPACAVCCAMSCCVCVCPDYTQCWAKVWVCLFTSEFAGVWNRWYSWSDVSLGHVADPTATNYDPGIPDLFPIWATKDQNYKYFKVSTAFT